MDTREEKRNKQIAVSLCEVRKYVSAETTRHIRRWESRSRPLAVDDPPSFLDVGVKAKLGEDFFLDETIPRHESELGYVSVTERSLMWKQKGCIEAVQKRTDWVVWARTSAQSREARRRREFESCGKVLAGQEARGKVAVGGGEKTAQDNNGGNSCRWKRWWKRGDVRTRGSPWPTLCWVHTAAVIDGRCRRHLDEAILSDAKKDECQVALSGEERDFWMGTEAGMLGAYNFQGMVLGGDGSDEAGRMGAGFCGLHRSDIKGCMRVGREREGTSSNRPELAALEAALRQAEETDDILYLCDNQSLLTEVNA